ncbi:MAG TPA: hypothetical protein VFS00_06935 [Polyangiaceae bacterium]|nr:hypothetical protein [Polyangiaceae bacterium]
MMTARFRRFALGALCAAGTGSCVQVLGIEEDRYLVEAPRPVDRWGCFNTTPPTTTNQEVTLIALDLLNTPALSESELDGPRVAEASVRACTPFDTECRSPIMNTITTTDAQGTARLPIPAAFEGYIEVVNPTFFPRIVYDDRLKTGLGAGYALAALFNKQIFSGIIPMIFDVGLEETGGFIYAEVYDCQGKFAEGVSFEIERTQATTRAFYTVEGVPNPTELETRGTRGGGFINAPPGSYRLTSKLRATGQVLSTNTIAVRGGWDTTVFIGPNRAQAAR